MPKMHVLARDAVNRTAFLARKDPERFRENSALGGALFEEENDRSDTEENIDPVVND